MLSSIGLCYLQLVLCTYLASILMGAPVFTDVFRTLGFSVYLVSIGFLPMIVRSEGNLRKIYEEIFTRDLSSADSKAKKLAWGTLIGAWLGAIPIPLDWDRWWQRWPITCLVSSTLGAAAALIVSSTDCWRGKREKLNK